MQTTLRRRIEEKKAMREPYCIKILFKEISENWKNQENMEEWLDMSNKDEERYEKEIEDFFSLEHIGNFQNNAEVNDEQ
jgi:hypothetical protein